MKCPYCKREIKCKLNIKGYCKKDGIRCPFISHEVSGCMSHKF